MGEVGGNILLCPTGISSSPRGGSVSHIAADHGEGPDYAPPSPPPLLPSLPPPPLPTSLPLPGIAIIGLPTPSSVVFLDWDRRTDTLVGWSGYWLVDWLIR